MMLPNQPGHRPFCLLIMYFKGLLHLCAVSKISSQFYFSLELKEKKKKHFLLQAPSELCLTNSCLKEPHCFKDIHTHKNSHSSTDILNQCTILENSPDTLRRGRTLENRKFMNNDHLFPLFSSNSKLKYDLLRIIKPRWKYCKRNSQLNYPAHTEACSACAPKE